MAEEGELLANEDAVLLVRAAGLGEHAPQLGRQGAGAVGLGRRRSDEDRFEVDVAGRNAETSRGLGDDRLPLSLEIVANGELALQVDESGEHGFRVLGLDRLGLRENDRE